jgi:hypothetical protein
MGRQDAPGTTHKRITFKSNDRFCGFEIVIKQPEGSRQLERIVSKAGDSHKDYI